MGKQRAYLQRVAAVRFAVYHFYYLLIDLLAALVAVSPVVGRAHAILANVKVFGVVDVLVRARLDAVDDLSSTS